MENRHLAAAAWVSHGLRNLLAPARLRLDAWMLRGNDVTLTGDDLARMRTTLQDVVQMVDGLELLRLDPRDQSAKGGTQWPDALRALLSSITSGAPSSLEITGDLTEVTRKAPQVVIAHLLVELALAGQRTVPGVQARYRIGLTNELVNVNATFSGVDAKTVDALARVIQDASEDVLLSANVSSAAALVEVSKDGEVVCRVDMPTTSAQGKHVAVPCPDTEASSFSVLCIDDNDHLLDALEVRLKQTDGFSHFLRSGSVSEALEILEQAPVSLVLVDVHLSASHDPLAAIQLLRAGSSDARVALFSGRNDDSLLKGAMANGADGFVFKGMASHDLIDAIVRLARGENVWATDAE